jgi:Obg family GTPase CgtA
MHFRREKFAPLGGPDGGDGGRGGNIILRGNAQLWTLLHLKYRKHVHAPNGTSGQAARRTGAQGEDVVLEVPIGTVAKLADTDEKIVEITEDQQEVILLPGGRGGLGNSHFKTPYPAGAPPRAARGAGPGSMDRARTQNPGRRGAGGLSQRGQIDAAVGGVGGQARNRRLSPLPPSCPTWAWCGTAKTFRS